MLDIILKSKLAAKKCLPEKRCRSYRVFLAAALLTLLSSLPGVLFYFLCGRSYEAGGSLSPRVLLTWLSLCAGALILSLFLRASFGLGSEAWFMSIASGRNPRAKRIIYWYAPRRSLKALNLRARLFLLRFLWTCVFSFPGLVLLAAVFYSLYETGIEYKTAFSLLAGGAAALAAGLVFAAVTVQRYMLAGFYLARCPHVSVREAIRKSTDAMDGQCMKALAFKLSFFMWFLLSIFIVPAFYVYPYYNRALSCFKLDIAKRAKA